MRLLLISLFALGVMAACSGSGTSSTEPTETPATVEADPGAQGDAVRIAFRLEYDEIAGFADWDEVEGVEVYKVEGEVIWWPDCESWDAGIRDPQSVPIAETLSAGTVNFTLPKPDDARYTQLKEFTLLVSAMDATGRVIGYNNTGQLNQTICGASMP